jgi:hypothetical protein
MTIADYIHTDDTRGRYSLTTFTRTKLADYIDADDTRGQHSHGLHILGGQARV